MSEGQQKDIYVSKRTVSGWLFGVAGDTWAEVESDLMDIFGEEAVNAAVQEVVGGVVITSGEVPTPPATPTGLTLFPSKTTDEAAMAKASAALSEGTTFEKCRKCNVGIRDKWIAPGISTKTNKPYKGFFACNNPGCR